MGNENAPKTSTATATTPASATTPTGKAAAGSSVHAQAKQLVVAINLEIQEGIAAFNKEVKLSEPLTITDLLTDHTAEWLATLAGTIGDNSQRGLPLSVRMENCQKEISEHWVTLPIKNNVAAPTDEWQTKANSLMIKKANLERAIKRDAEAKKAKASTTQ